MLDQTIKEVSEVEFSGMRESLTLELFKMNFEKWGYLKRPRLWKKIIELKKGVLHENTNKIVRPWRVFREH